VAVRGALEPAAEGRGLSDPAAPALPEARPPEARLLEARLLEARLLGERLIRAQGLLGHQFARPALLGEALTHRSASSGRKRMRRGRKMAKGTSAGSNERLEFIGDRVLGLVMAEWLAERFPDEQEGQLGPRLAHLVSRETIAEAAERLGLAEALTLGANEAQAGVGRLSTVLADALEAAIGAMYLDGGLEPARRFVRTTWSVLMTSQVKPPKDPKTGLQERLAVLGEPPPVYKVMLHTGPSHAPHFVISVGGAGHTGTGEGSTKRIAERGAAKDLLGKLK
jgi:ribonuclease-3